VEVLALLDRHVEGGVTFTEGALSCAMHGTELVDRDHVTRLQADCEALAIMHRQAQVKWGAERDTLKAEVGRLNSKCQAADIALAYQTENLNDAQSELIKARELLLDVGTSMGSTEGRRSARKKINAFLAHQSAPAANLSDVAHDRAYRNGLMAGFGMGLNGNEAAYKRALIGYQREIVETVQSVPAAKGEH
jgi:hypothetical protein